MKNKILSTYCKNEEFALFYLGQMGFIVKHREKYLLIDGYLSDYVDTHCSNALVKWERSYPAPISPKALDFIDAVFCTHAHFDHADPETIGGLLSVNQKAIFYVGGALLNTLLSYGVPRARIVVLPENSTVTLWEDVSVRAIPAAHETLLRDENGNALTVGFRFTLGENSLFHAGDGCPYEGLSSLIGKTDIVILPINGRDAHRTQVLDIIGCFHPEEAVSLSKSIGARLTVPAHFDLYRVNGADPDYFASCHDSIYPEGAYHIFAPGDELILPC